MWTLIRSSQDFISLRIREWGALETNGLVKLNKKENTKAAAYMLKLTIETLEQGVKYVQS